MSEAVSDRLLMGNELRTAIAREEMYLCFQPQINLSNGRIFGFEALLRWQSGRYGLVPPNRFIPLAEETGLIVPIGKWVFEKSCEFLAAVSTLDSEVMVSVNVAPQQLEQANFIEEISASVQRAGVKPEQLCIEVTESSVIASLSMALNQLEIIRDAHLKIALDDFGTGFSSLNYLNQLPIDILKIDKSFTEKISNSSKEYLLIKSIMGLSSDLNLKLIMEGIETEAQLALIQDMGKPIIQGYYYGKPMSQSDALNYMLDYTEKESES
jgi:EAL domain-containing protein (putative c-di-GMP-specific phosphodiesterase class I)